MIQGDCNISVQAIQRPIHLIQLSRIFFWLLQQRKRLAICWNNDLEEQHTQSYLTILSNYIPHCNWPTTAEKSRTSSTGCTKQWRKKQSIRRTNPINATFAIALFIPSPSRKHLDLFGQHRHSSSAIETLAMKSNQLLES